MMTTVIIVLIFIFSFTYLRDKKRRNTYLGKTLLDFLMFFIVWFAGFPFVIHAGKALWFPIWMGLVPYAYFFFLINVYLLMPLSDKKKKKIIIHILQLIVASIILAVPFFIICAIRDITLISCLQLFLITTIISFALARFVYTRNKEYIQKLIFLKRELSTASSNLQSLRSQINPHFLFNALNTLYGLSINENAIRTGDGIQRLGDMMRFMLRENQKQEIPLFVEIKYIKDYIYLQELRLSNSGNIQMTIQIDEPSQEYLIAPMLLVPFIENAFKHGIRLQEPSWIYVELHCENSNLYFKVRNSLYAEIDKYTERANTGIGIENTKERLKLLYADKYTLEINDNNQEFSIELILNLEQ